MKSVKGLVLGRVTRLCLGFPFTVIRLTLALSGPKTWHRQPEYLGAPQGTILSFDLVVVCCALQDTTLMFNPLAKIMFFLSSQIN